MANMSQRSAAIALCIGIGAVVALYIWWPPSSGETLQPQVARLLGIPSDFVHLNLPPTAGRYPGAILVRNPEGRPVMMRPVARPSMLVNASPVSEMRLNSTLSGTAWLDGSLNAAAVLHARSKADLDVRVELAQVRVVEYEGGVYALREQLLSDNEVRRQRSRQLPVEVIVRAIEAVPTFIIQRGSGLSAEGWAEKSKAIHGKLGGSINDKGSLRISIEAPVVVAYETLKVSYITDSLAPSAPNRVELTPVAATSSAPLVQSRVDGAGSSSKRIGYVSFGTSTYSHAELGDLPAVGSSLRLAAEALESVGAKPLRKSPPDGVWTKAALLDAIEVAAAEAKEKRLDGLVVYYIGHAAISDSGHTYLFLSDYESDIKRLTGGPLNTKSGSTKARAVREAGEWMEAANASAVPAKRIKGAVSLEEIYEALETSETLFAVIVDGCSVRNAAAVGERLGVGFSSVDFPGMSPEEIGGIIQIVERFGAPTYMRSENVIVLAQRPGVPAVVTDHPYLGAFGVRVGPLSAALFNRAVQSEVDGQTSWGRLLGSLAKLEGQSNWTEQGSISWSQFDCCWDDLSMQRTGR